MTDKTLEDFKQLYASITLPTSTDDEFQIALKMYEACKAKWCVSAPSGVERRKAFEHWWDKVDPTDEEIDEMISLEREGWTSNKRDALLAWRFRDAELAAANGRADGYKQALIEAERRHRTRVAEIEAQSNHFEAAYNRSDQLRSEAEARLAAIDAEVGPEPENYDIDDLGRVFPTRVDLAKHHKHRAEQLAKKVVELQAEISKLRYQKQCDDTTLKVVKHALHDALNNLPREGECASFIRSTLQKFQPAPLADSLHWCAVKSCDHFADKLGGFCSEHQHVKHTQEGGKQS